MELLVPFASHSFISHCEDPIVIFYGFWIRINFHENLLVYQCLQFGKNMAGQFFIFKVIFVVGYYNEFTVVQRQIVCKLFAKDN